MELVFVHGALVGDGAWWWRPTADLLEARTGIRNCATTNCRDRPSSAWPLVRQLLDVVEGDR